MNQSQKSIFPEKYSKSKLDNPWKGKVSYRIQSQNSIFLEEENVVIEWIQSQNSIFPEKEKLVIEFKVRIVLGYEIWRGSLYVLTILII